MHPNSKKRILCRLPYIAENTGNLPKLLVYLLSKGIIEIRERDNIISHPSDYDKCVDLCTTLLDKKDDSYIHLLNGLDESGNSHIREQILKPLTTNETNLSIDECFYNLNTVMKGSKAERKFQFYESLGKVNKLIFQPIGSPGKIGVYKALCNYYVLNSDGERLFRFTWDTDRIFNGFKPMFSCWKYCMDLPSSYTKPLRLGKNLIGETIMEIDTPASSLDINVGNDFIGSIQGHYIKNAENQTIWKVLRSIENGPVYNSECWDVYDFTQGVKGQLCSKFGFNAIKDSNENYMHGIKFPVTMPSEFKALLLGTAIIHMDISMRGSKIWNMYGQAVPYLVVIGLPLLIVVILFFTGQLSGGDGGVEIPGITNSPQFNFTII